jgi:hypothetical protein
MSQPSTTQDGFPREAFYKEFGAAIDNGTAANFAGAGLSRPAGFVDWRDLLRGLAKELNLDIDIEDNLVAVAQYHVNANNQSRDRLNQLLVDEFDQVRTPTTSHEVLARLPIRTYWTTNYDRLIEDSLRTAGRRVEVKTTESRLTTSTRRATAVVYKMHGDTVAPERMVITQDDYEKYAREHGPFLATLQSDLINKIFLFLGFSFTDPNLQFVLGQLRAALGQNPRTHYAVMRREHRRDHKTDQQFEYALNKQRLRIQDLVRYGIRTVLVDEYSEIPELLSELERRYYRRQIVVSGAAASFDPLGQPRLEELCRALGARIINDDYNLVTGFGLGIGSPLIMGALETLYRQEEPEVERRMKLRPFPQSEPQGMSRQELYRRYREDMVKGAGFIVFVSGNRTNDSATVEASPGVMEEYRLAVERNLYPVPIGATGWAAQEIWAEVQSNFDRIYPAGAPREPFEKLADQESSNEQLLDAVFDLVHYLTPRLPRQ